jgi:hypothetical protein
MSNVIVVFDNLLQQHRSGIIGLTQNVKAICSSEKLPQRAETALRARKSAETFRKMFQS